MSKSLATDLEIIKTTSKEILLSFVDVAVKSYADHGYSRRTLNSYLYKQEGRREEFFERLKYLKRRGYIEYFVEGKEKYIELTPKGTKRVQEIFAEDFQINRPAKWDKKWRVVIFDIPETQKKSRDVFRHKLGSLDFIQIQKSVYVFPFECTDEIQTLTNLLQIGKNVTIMISEIIQGEEKIIEHFIDKNILSEKYLRN